MFDVAVIGGGIGGLATAARLQAAGLSTVVFEAHSTAGGCAGYFRRRGFSFDVGATTLVDFAPGGVGADLLEEIGMSAPEGEALPGYVAWLPDRRVTLYRNRALWAEERLRAFGNSSAHRSLWARFDRIEEVFWRACRKGVRLPMQSLGDIFSNLKALGASRWTMLRYLRQTMGGTLRAAGLRGDKALTGLLSMLIEDTVHATLDEAPLINGVLGCSIRGAGLMRARGGMFGFWKRFTNHYRALGGRILLNHTVTAVRGTQGDFLVATERCVLPARQVVSALPIHLIASIAPPHVKQALGSHLRKNQHALGGAIVVFLAVPEHEVAGQEFTHHQLLIDYEAPSGNGNNMFISVSAHGDTESAPVGHRAVMISTHCSLSAWQGLEPSEYRQRKREIADRLIRLAQRVYPNLGDGAVVREEATPRTYERFTRRPLGAVGGFRLSLVNSNQNAVPYDIGVPGFWLCGDTTWPGLGTVACVIASGIVAKDVVRRHLNLVPPGRPAGAYRPAGSGAISKLPPLKLR